MKFSLKAKLILIIATAGAGTALVRVGFSNSANVRAQSPQPTPAPTPRRALPKPIGGSRGFAQYEKRDASVRLIAATATRPIDPARAFYDSGTTAFNNGDYQKAVQDFSQAVKLRPDWPEAHYSLAVALTEVEKLKEAIAQFEQVLRLNPTDQLKILSSYNIGNAQSELGGNEAAVEAYQRAIQIDPKLSKPHNNLGLAYAALGRIPEALAEFKRAVELRDDYAEAHFNLGVAYLQSGKKEAAQAQQQLLLKLKPELATRLEALLKADHRAERYQSADFYEEPWRQQLIEEKLLSATRLV